MQKLPTLFSFFSKRNTTLLLVVSAMFLPLEHASAANKYTKQTASNALVQARITARALTPKKAADLREIADDLETDNFIFESREICQILCKSKFVTAEDYVILASTYMSVLGDDEKGKPVNFYLDKAIALDPNYGPIYYHKAKLANQEGKYAESLKYANKCLSCRDPYPDVYTCKAIALTNLGRLSEAQQAIDLAIKAFPNDSGIYRIRGSILENQKRYAEAAENYRLSRKLTRSDWTSFRLVYCLEMQNKLAEALAETNKLIAENPKDGEAYRTRALLKIKLKDVAGAIKDYDQCIDLEPTAKTYKDRAKLHLQLGHKDLYKRDLADAQKLEASPF